MVTPELISYIWEERNKGISDYIILANLRQGGWTEDDFKQAVAALPPPRTKFDPSMLRTLEDKTVWVGPTGEKSAFTKRKWLIFLCLVFVLLCIAFAIMYFAYPASLEAIGTPISSWFSGVLSPVQNYLR